MIKVSDLPINGLQDTRPASNHERDNRDEDYLLMMPFYIVLHTTSTILVLNKIIRPTILVNSICHQFFVKMGYWEYPIAYVINCVDSDEKCLRLFPGNLLAADAAGTKYISCN